MVKEALDTHVARVTPVTHVTYGQAIVKDALARKLGSSGAACKEPFTADEVEHGLRAVSSALLDGAATLEGDGRALGASLS